jgi:hypothetical protein
MNQSMKDSMFKGSIALGIIVLFVGVSIGSGISESVEFISSIDTQTFYPTDDAHILENHPDTNTNHREFLRTRGLSDWRIQPLIKFNISSIPEDIFIDAATLNLYYYRNEDGNPVGHTLNLHRITSDWNESTVTWNTQPSYHPDISSSAVVPSSPGVWMEWDVTDDVQAFINGQATNFGWRMIDILQGSNAMTYFYSKEYGNLTPYLKIEINEPPSAPLITGPTTGKAGVDYEYTFVAFDPEEHEITYWIFWGDDFVDVYYSNPSGEPITVNHTWEKKGTYTIRAQAIDTFFAESDWSSLEVTMPRDISMWRFVESRLPWLFRLLERIVGM